MMNINFNKPSLLNIQYLTVIHH